MRRFVLVVCAAAMVTGVAEARDTRPAFAPLPCPDQQWQKRDPKFDPLAGAKAFYGSYEGGLYQIEVPDRWNGELVLVAHGLAPNTGPNGSALHGYVDRPVVAVLREHWIRSGFAWAASSYRCNGIVTGVGLLDTLALRPIFKGVAHRSPKRTFLVGGSMGGAIVTLALREEPTGFAGALAMCPAVPPVAIDTSQATLAAAEAITNVSVHRESPAADLRHIEELLGTPPNYTSMGKALANVQINLTGGPRPFAVEGLATRFMANVADGVLFPRPLIAAATNADTRYRIDAGFGVSADELNRRAARRAADPAFRRGSGSIRELAAFDGKIQRPLLTLHGTGDLWVPISVERQMREAAEKSGTGALLVQRIIRVSGHCGFSAAEQTAAFDALVDWVERGKRPDGDDVMGDLRDAGRKFTNPLRPGDPGTLTVTPRADTR